MTAQSKLGWLAGLFDGEGCIHINRNRAGLSRKDILTDSFRLYAQITMGHIEALDRCVDITGVGSVQKHTVSNVRANDAYCWMTSAHDAESVLKLIQPMVVVKAEEVCIALSFCRIAPWYGGRFRGPKPDTLVDECRKHYWQLRMLKPRWRFYAVKLSKADIREIDRLGLSI